MPAPREVENATWEIVTTDAGHHARLRGSNGEPVMISEPYTRLQTAEESVRIARRATGPVRYVDER